jgi:hypothetical protein
MTEPIKPAGWLVLDPEGGYEYGCMDPDIGRDFCHQHIKDAQESGIPRARKWVVRESFSRDQVEQATAGLRAEVERLRAALEKLARLGNEPYYGNSEGNMIARAALKETK